MRIMDEAKVRPFELTYYCERRDPEFESKRHDVLVVYRQLQMCLDADGNLVAEPTDAEGRVVHTLSYDEKPSIHPIPDDVHLLHPEAFLLRVEGESMNRILPNGCYALVDPCTEIEHDGQPYAVCVDGRAATIKRVRRLAHGIELEPDSTDPTFSPQVLVDGGDPDAPAPHTVAVIGRVVWHCLPVHWSY